MGSSKKQTVGYKYNLGMHAIFCHGPVDRFTRLTFDGNRIAWEGEANDITRREDVDAINVSAKELFGGDDIGREGGVSGFVDFEPGEPDQTQNPYLQTQLGLTDIPAFRGVAGLVFRQFYFGTSAYLKKFSARFTRIMKTTNGATQWYPEKAQVTVPSADTPIFEVINLDATVDGADTAANAISGNKGFFISGLDPDDTLKLVANVGQFAEHPPSWVAWSPWGIPEIDGPSTGSQWKVFVIPDETAAEVLTLGVSGPYDGYEAARAAGIAAFPTGLSLSGASSYRIYIQDTPLNDNSGGMSLLLYANPVIDMNPAHIIRECLTDNNWGMGYNAADVDDTSFEAAADQLFDEGMGMSILWDRQMPIEDFIKEVCKHIDASVYVDRVTGKFVITLIRGGYTVSALPLFDESNCKVEDFQRPQTGELVNSVTVEYWDTRKNVEASLTVEDPALVQMQGATINTTVQYPGFTNATTASRVALRDLKTLSNPLATCTIYAGSDAETLNVGSLLRLSWAEYGVVDMPMRVTGIAYGDGVSNKVKIQVSQDSFALPDTGVIAPPDVSWEDPNEPPAPSPYEIAIEMPYVELLQQLGLSTLEDTLAATPEVGYAGMAVSRPSSSAINAKLMLDAGAGYEEVGIIQFSPIALLTAAIPQEYGPTVVAIDGGVDLDLALELGVVGSWCQIGNELCIVEALSDTSITLGRGTLDTTPEPHADNSPIFFWDNFAQNDDEQYVLNDDLNLKSLTVTGQGTLAEADAIARPLEIVARAIRPYPPAKLAINGLEYPAGPIEFDFDITWVARNRLTQSDVLVDTSEDTIAAEAGTTYTVRLYLDDVLEDEITGITDLFYNDASLPANGTARVEVWSVRDGYESFQPLWAEFDYVGAVVFTSTDVPDATVDEPFSYTLEWVGGTAPFAFTIEAGALPDGLSLNASTGEISGTPTVEDTFNYTVRITDDNGTFDELIVEQIVEASGWTPAQITTQLWFDAADPTTITESGGAVSQWNDKSGNARHVAQATGANQPSLIAAELDGKSIIRFDGTNDVLTGNSNLSGLAQNVGTVFMAAVRKWPSPPAAASSLFFIGTATGGTRSRLDGGRTASKAGVGGRRLDGDSFAGISSSANIPNAWQIHVGIFDYTNASLAQYIDGTQDGSGLPFGAGNTSNTTPSVITVGGLATVADMFAGDVAELIATHDITTYQRRLIEGYLAWRWGLETSLPAAHPFRYVSPQKGDANFANVGFLCHFEGVDGATTVGEGGMTGYNLTFNGTAQIDTAQFKFGQSSLLLDGNSDYVSAGDSNDWHFGSGDFTVEAWVRFNSVSGHQIIISHYEPSSPQRSWAFAKNDNATKGLTFTYSTDGSSTSSFVSDWPTAPVTTGVWYHVAVCRSGADLRFFVDGVQAGVTHNFGSTTLFNSNTSLRIGASGNSPVNFFNGWIDEVRITKGVARYTANFTPPSAPFPDAI